MRSTVSVVVPVYNGSRTIQRTIECLLHQTLPPREIIAVDDGSTDGTAAILRGFGNRIVYVPKRNGGPASARNLGIRFASGDYIAFTDSDCYPRRDWLEQLMGAFDNPAIGGVGGTVRSADRNPTGEYVDLIGLLDPQPDASGEIPYVITANACFRREALLRAGLFNESFRKAGGEEAELCYRVRQLGLTFRAVPRALVLHEHRQSLRSLVRTLANYGEGAALIAELWPERRMANPGRLLLRRLVGCRAWARRLNHYLARFGGKKALYFSVLDYLRQPAFLWGYLRGQRRAAASQRDHSLL